jgi:hypothetical protein
MKSIKEHIYEICIRSDQFEHILPGHLHSKMDCIIYVESNDVINDMSWIEMVLFQHFPQRAEKYHKNDHPHDLRLFVTWLFKSIHFNCLSYLTSNETMILNDEMKTM